ncbi:MAG: hypothetical protein ACYCPT_01920 [Acidimicrobiales bacterium]
MSEGRLPPTISGLMAALSDHQVEDREAFAGMARIINAIGDKQNTQLDILRAQNVVLEKQNERLDKILSQAEASGVERGRRVEREAREERWDKRWRFVIIPVAVALGHFFTKWLHL